MAPLYGVSPEVHVTTFEKRPIAPQNPVRKNGKAPQIHKWTAYYSLRFSGKCVRNNVTFRARVQVSQVGQMYSYEDKFSVPLDVDKKKLNIQIIYVAYSTHSKHYTIQNT